MEMRTLLVKVTFSYTNVIFQSLSVYIESAIMEISSFYGGRGRNSKAIVLVASNAYTEGTHAK